MVVFKVSLEAYAHLYSDKIIVNLDVKLYSFHDFETYPPVIITSSFLRSYPGAGDQI